MTERDIDEILYKYGPELTDVEHIKLRAAINTYVNQARIEEDQQEQTPSTPNSSEWLDEIFTKLNEPLNSSRPWLDDAGAKQAILTHQFKAKELLVKSYESKVEDLAMETRRNGVLIALVNEQYRRLYDRGCRQENWPKECPDCKWMHQVAKLYGTKEDLA